MELDALIKQMEMLAQDGAYDVEMWLDCMCICASLEDFAAPMEVKSEEAWDLFHTLLRRLLKVIGHTDDSAKARIEELRDLLALEERYKYRDSDFSQALEDYCSEVASKAVQEQSKADQYRIADLEQSEIQLREEAAAKDDTIAQLRKLLEEYRAPREPAQADDSLAQLRQEKQALAAEKDRLQAENDELRAEIRQLRDAAASSPPPAAPELPPLKKTELHFEPSEEPSQAPEPSDAPPVYYLDKHDVLSGAGMTPTALHQLPDSLCAQVEILKITEGSGPWGVVGPRLHRFPNLIALVLGHSVTSLEHNGLRCCPDLNIIRFDNPNCSIEEPPSRLRGVSIVATPGGYVEKYAQKHNLSFMPPHE